MHPVAMCHAPAGNFKLSWVNILIIVKTIPHEDHHHKCMVFDKKPPQYRTSAELEEAIRRHREHTKKLQAEARSHRKEASKSRTPQEPRDWR
jgi:hypothetical protein